MKITPEMLKDWRSEDGWRDFNGQLRGYDYREFPHEGGLLIISYKEDIPIAFAVEVAMQTQQSEERRYCPA